MEKEDANNNNNNNNNNNSNQQPIIYNNNNNNNNGAFPVVTPSSATRYANNSNTSMPARRAHIVERLGRIERRLHPGLNLFCFYFSFILLSSLFSFVFRY
jgi:hypothetical protein